MISEIPRLWLGSIVNDAYDISYQLDQYKEEYVFVDDILGYDDMCTKIDR